jgi:hypothetical protein
VPDGQWAAVISGFDLGSNSTKICKTTLAKDSIGDEKLANNDFICNATVIILLQYEEFVKRIRRFRQDC